ncbi:MAG: hypothetical protein EBQ95_06955 [Gammaproteobacteria bacterium]|nr:hypothetical protein [Gammaproteobacteria bacterium]
MAGKNKHQHHDSPWHRAMDMKSKRSGVRQINYMFFKGEKEDTTFKNFLNSSPAKTLLDYYSNHWDRIMGIHYEPELLDIVDYAFLNKKFNPDAWGTAQKTFKGGMDYLIFPLVARKLLMDVTSNMIDTMKNRKDISNAQCFIDSLKLIAWGILEFMRHAIGLMVMTAVVLSTPILLLADHDLVSKDYNKNLKARTKINKKDEKEFLLNSLGFN